jgi:predicted  nucleic acid-binding Zn-ribbon protein
MTPTEMTALAQNLWKAQQKLKAAKAKLQPQEDAVANLEAQLQAAMIEAKMEAVASKNATVALKRTEFAELTDDKAFFEYVAKNHAWDLVRKQVNVGAARARWDDNIVIPGVQKGVRVALSVTTRK